MSPEIIDMRPIAGEKFKMTMLLLNPWALMINTVDSSITSLSDGLFITISTLISLLLSVNLFLISVHVVNLKK